MRPSTVIAPAIEDLLGSESHGLVGVSRGSVRWDSSVIPGAARNDANVLRASRKTK
jgi:hypothetical protein